MASRPSRESAAISRRGDRPLILRLPSTIIWRDPLDQADRDRWAGCRETSIRGVGHRDGLAGRRHQGYRETVGSGVRGREAVVRRHAAELRRHQVAGAEGHGSAIAGRDVAEPIRGGHGEEKVLPAVGVLVEVAITSLLAGAALTVTFAVAEKPFTASDAVSVCGPALISVAEYVPRPLVSVELGGSTTPDEVSLLPKCTVPP